MYFEDEMRLTTLMEILEREIGASPTARRELERMVAERGQKDAAASTRPRGTEAATEKRRAHKPRRAD